MFCTPSHVRRPRSSMIARNMLPGKEFGELRGKQSAGVPFSSALPLARRIWRLARVCQYGPDEIVRRPAYSRARTLPRSGHVQHADFVFHDPLVDEQRVRLLPQIHKQTRLSALGSQTSRQFRTAGQLVSKQDQGAVRIQNIEFRADRVIRGFCFPQPIFRRDATVFRDPPAGAPTAVLDAQLDGRIQGSSVHARLSTRDDPLHESGPFAVFHAHIVTEADRAFQPSNSPAKQCSPPND